MSVYFSLTFLVSFGLLHEYLILYHLNDLLWSVDGLLFCQLLTLVACCGLIHLLQLETSVCVDVYLEWNKCSSLHPGHKLASVLSPQVLLWSDMEQNAHESLYCCRPQNPTCIRTQGHLDLPAKKKITSKFPVEFVVLS